MIIVSALSLSLKDKDRFRDWEIERAWQYINWQIQHTLSSLITYYKIITEVGGCGKDTTNLNVSPRVLILVAQY